MNWEKLYEIMPVFLQNIACNVRGIKINRTRYNDDFKKMLHEFLERKSWSYDDICSYRDERLRKIILHCYETVPYYRNMFRSLNIYPDEIRDIKDLELLPIISKKEINKNPQDFISSKAGDYQCIASHTSGSTGAGFKFVTTMESLHSQWAAYWRLYLRSGINFSLKQGTFSGQMIVPVKQKKPPYWRYINSQNRVYFSAYHENEKNLSYYYDELKRSGIEWISGYPSLISLLADYIVRNNLPNPGVKFVTTCAENLYGFQETSIRNAFRGAKFGQVYGQAENVAIITQQSNGDMFIDEDGAAVELVPNEYGSWDIIGTNLYNYAMPLVRYQTCDTAAYVTDSSQRRKIVSLDGRKEDYICLPNGKKLGRIDYAFKDAMHIVESQIYQKKDYSVVIRVVLGAADGRKEAEKAREWLRAATGNSISISINYVDFIEKTNTHKLRYVVSEI